MSSDAFDFKPPEGAPAEAWAAQIEALLAEVEAALLGPARTALLCQVADISARRLSDPDGALATLQAALAADPASGRVIHELERLARGHGLWPAVAAATAEVAAGLAERDPKGAADLWAQIAFWNEHGRAALDEAAVAAEAALALAPGHGGALALLENLHRRQRSWDRLVDVLARRRAQPGADLVKIAEGYREVLRYQPRHALALEALGGVGEDAGEWESAADAYRKLVAVAEGGAGEAAARYRLARLLKERLHDARGAEEQLVLALALPDSGRDVPNLLLLAALYRERKDWLKARQLLGRAAAAVTDPGDQARLLGEAAEICAGPLDDEAQATALYAEIVAIDGTRIDLVEKLAESKLRRGDLAGLLPLAERLAAGADSQPPAERARLLHRLGRARAATGDETGALEAYRAAAGLPRPAPPAAPAVVQSAAPKAVDGAAEPASTGTAPAPPAADAERADDAAPATPTDAAVLAPPADAAVLDVPADAVVLDAAPGSPDTDTSDYVALEIEMPPEAAVAPPPAAPVSREDMAVAGTLLVPLSEAARAARADLAELSFRHELWDEAAAAYASLLADPAGVPRDVEVPAWERLGLARLRGGAPGTAIAALERALALEPRRSRAIEALVEAARATGDDDAVIRHAQAFLAITDDPQTKLGLLEHLATIHRDRRNDPQRAIAAYRAALELWPQASTSPSIARSIMHRLLELLTETKQWRQAVQLLFRLAALVVEAGRAPYFAAAGNILVEELAAPAEAIDAFEQALDADPQALEIFERLDRLVTEARDWKAQARLYRRQIKRLGAAPSLQDGDGNDNPAEAPAPRPSALPALWRGLGEICRTRLKDFPAAIAAFEVAAGLDPAATDLRRVLAELYRLAGPERYADAAEAHRVLIARAADVAEMALDLRTLVRLFVELGRLDEAYAAAAALALLGQADADEQALYEQYRPTRVLRATDRLTEESWLKHVYHPDEDRRIGAVLATLLPVVAGVRARPLKELPLKKKQRHEVATDPAMPCKVLAYGSAVLGVPLHEVYLSPEAPADVEILNVRGATTGTGTLVLGGALAGETADVQRADIQMADVQIAFVVGRALCGLRADHLLRWASFVPTLAELEILVRAGLRLVAPDLDVPAEQAAPVADYGKFLEASLAPHVREQLRAIVRRFPATSTVDVARWARGAFLTSIRAGFLLCGDLEIAARLGQAAAPAAGVDPADVVRDLVVWSVSAEHFELRGALGLHTVNLAFRG